MKGADGEALLRKLAHEFDHPEYQVRINWFPNSITVWDNILVQHRATPDYSEPRYLERMTITGVERPVGPTGRTSRLWPAEAAA